MVKSEPVNWYRLSAAQTLERLGTSAEGLSQTEADARLQRYGRNHIQEGRRRGPWRMFFEQFTDFMIVVLLAAAVVSGLVGDVTDTLVIPVSYTHLTLPTILLV